MRSLIKHKRITTTLAKAKAARPVAERMVTFGKRGTVTARRIVAARLRASGPGNDLRKAERIKWRKEEDVVRILFEEIAPSYKERRGGYTRIVKLAPRRGDAAKTAILEWVDLQPVAEAAATPAAAGAKTDEAKPEAKTEEKS